MSQHQTPAGVPYRVKIPSWVPRLFGHDCVTIGRTIYCRNRKLPAHTHAHEAKHIEQFAELGVFGFLRRYLWAQIRKGYKANPFELQAHLYADTHESDYGTVYAEGRR